MGVGQLTKHIHKFVRREDGTLLVFFAVCTMTILGIVALSFDLGRRAATQTDMQSFVDNVALASAGELDGEPDAITRATRAATDVVVAANDQLKSGTAGQDYTMALDQIVFYETLPAEDMPSSLSTSVLRTEKYQLPTASTTTDPTLANFVGIRLTSVDVPWIFASIFSPSDLPGEGIGAVAVAGLSEWTCDIAPLAFCLPNAGGSPLPVFPGQAMSLTTALQGQTWGEGDFGFISVDIDSAGVCAGIPDAAGRLACQITLDRRVAACFQTRQADVETGQRPDQELAAFNMAFDDFSGAMIQFFNDPRYAPGPHTIRGFEPDPGDICVPGAPSTDTMAFPLDDCHTSGTCLGGAYGDGDWSEGREEYVEVNYGLVLEDDDGGDDGDDGGIIGLDDGTFFDFPEAGLSRYQYYLREIERAENGGVMDAAGVPPYTGSVYQVDNDGSGEAVEDYTTWDDFWPDTYVGLNPIIPDAHGRSENGLPQCNTANLDPDRADRRVMLAAGIHCPSSGDVVTGNDSEVRAEAFYRVFLLGPATNEIGFPPTFDLNVEVIEEVDITTDREVVQLYR